MEENKNQIENTNIEKAKRDKVNDYVSFVKNKFEKNINNDKINQEDINEINDKYDNLEDNVKVSLNLDGILYRPDNIISTFKSHKLQYSDKKLHEKYVKKFKQKYNLENADLNKSTKVLLFKKTETEEDDDGNEKYISKKDLKGIDHLGNEQYYTQINALYATTTEQIKLFEDMRHYYFTLMDNSILKDNFNIQIEDNNEYNEDNNENIKNFKEEINNIKLNIENKENELNNYRQNKLNTNDNNDNDKLKDDLSKLNIKDLRKKLEVLIAQNLKNINKNKISKYYKTAYTARSPKIIETFIELHNSIKDVKKEINENNKKKNLKAKVIKNKNDELDEKEIELMDYINRSKNDIKRIEKHLKAERKADQINNGKFNSMIFVLDLLCLDQKFYESVKDKRPYIQLVICVSDNNTKKLKLGKNVELDPEQFKKNKQEYVDELFDMDNNNSENNVAVYSKYVEYEIYQDA